MSFRFVNPSGRPSLPGLLAVGFLALGLAGCPTIRTEHDIRITLDVNLKVQEELDNFFGDIDAASETVSAPDAQEPSAPQSDA